MCFLFSRLPAWVWRVVLLVETRSHQQQIFSGADLLLHLPGAYRTIDRRVVSLDQLVLDFVVAMATFKIKKWQLDSPFSCFAGQVRPHSAVFNMPNKTIRDAQVLSYAYCGLFRQIRKIVVALVSAFVMNFLTFLDYFTSVLPPNQMMLITISASVFASWVLIRRNNKLVLAISHFSSPFNGCNLTHLNQDMQVTYDLSIPPEVDLPALSYPPP